MDESIKLSVIVPVYNVEEYIKDSVNSVINQTYKNLEIILVDDGSTDNSGKICDEFAKKDSRVVVVHKENGGIVSARKAGISLATGEYAINFDPDDWIEEIAYECVIEKINEYHPDIMAFGYIKDHEGLLENYPIKISEGYYTAEEFWKAFNQTVEDNYFFVRPINLGQWDKAVKTELFKKHQSGCSEQLKKNVDDAVIFPCMLEMKSIYIDLRCWYHYCVRRDSILWKTGDKDYDRCVLWSKHIISCYLQYGLKTNINKKYILHKCVQTFMMNVPEIFFSDEQCKIYPEIKKNDNVIVYGKGVFANRLITRIQQLGYCNIIDNIDSRDADRLLSMDGGTYDYIVVSVFNAEIVKAILDVLAKLNIPEEKILIIEKENITPDLLPDEIREMYEGV